MSFLPSSARRVLTMRRVVAGIATITVVAVRGGDRMTFDVTLDTAPD